MKSPTVLRRAGAMLALLACALTASPGAEAALVSVDAGAGHDSVFVMGSDLRFTDFRSTLAGTVTVQLQDIGWTDPLQSLSASLNKMGKILQQHQGTTAFSFDILRDETLSLGIYAIAGGTRQYGLYTIDWTFTLSPTEVPVPLPAAGLLLASGLALLPGLRRRRLAVVG